MAYILNLSEDWQSHSGEEVQAFIKAQFGTKYGYFYIPQTKDANDGYYHLYCFANENDYITWSSDTDTYSSLLLQEVPIPISTDFGKIYSARLYVQETPTDAIITIEKSHNIHLRFCGVETDNGIATNSGVMGTITIQRSVDGGISWTTVGTTRLDSRDMSSTTYDTIDIGQHFGDTNPQQIRVRASYVVYDDEENVIASPVSAWITFSSIICTTLTINPTNNITLAVKASQMALPLAYQLTGEVARNLHLKCNGYEQTFAIGANEYTNHSITYYVSMYDGQNTHGLFEHGVRTIEAWLTCSDGQTNDALSSKHVFTQVMVDAEIQNATPQIVIRNLQKKLINYIPSDLCEWTIWVPDGMNVSSVPVLLKLTNQSGSEEYLDEQFNATKGSVYSQTVTVEIENTIDDTLIAYFKAYANEEENPQYSVSLDVDNTEKYAPAVADWALNPKTRNNTTAQINDIIDGANATFSGFSFISDGWVEKEDETETVVGGERTKVKQKVLRIMAGESVTIEKDWLEAFTDSSIANVTLELDFMVRNVVDETLPIIEAKEIHGGGWKGLQMLPLEGVVMTASRISRQYQDFRWQEDKRTHVAINILSQYVSGNSSNSLAVCRIFINGVINREFLFNWQDVGEWHSEGSNIVIGHPSADIDIYGIRLYNRALSNDQILKNYTATIPVSEEKLKFRNNNDILNSQDHLDFNKCRNKSNNTLVWHGVQPYHEMTEGQNGWWEVDVFNENGTRANEYSGTICEASKSLKATRQGTTANTYYYSNLQTKLKSVSDAFAEEVTDAWVACGLGTATEAAEKKTKALASELPYTQQGTGACPSGIWVAIDHIHPDYTDYTESTSREGYAFVSDGWIDRNGMYRGAQYKSADGVPYATKLVGKINYASSMQSHLMGSCRMYNDLHQAICGTGGRMQGRVAKYEELFLFFVQGNNDSSPIYQGGITWGAGKMDDPTWGYNKKNNPNFCMIEGADNNLPLTDFRVPWDSDKIFAEVEDGEVAGWIYNGATNLDLDRCKTESGQYRISPTQVVTAKGPSATVMANIKAFFNFVYRHNTRIKVFDGPFDGVGSDTFLASEYKNQTNYQWWCTADFKLRRYDFIDQQWVDAGWDDVNEQPLPLNLHTTYPNVELTGTNEEVNARFIAAIADDAKEHIGDLVDINSLKFHYAFLNQFLAGTDNCSKNTYYTFDDVLGKWVFSQDDMDTILATDNSGFQSKPYYIDRQRPTAEGSNVVLYEGSQNGLFNLVESMWEEDGSIRAMMKQIFSGMSSLVSTNDNIPSLIDSEKPTPWGALWKYFFMIQKRIPAVAYNEQARIRYEEPQSRGFVSDRGVMPIAQSMGDQLQSEIQYMKRRLVLFASYAEWGDFSVSSGSSGNIGLADASARFGINGYATLDGNGSYIVFNGLVPHQYIWPGGRVGQTNHALRQRCAPGVPVTFDLTGNSSIDGDVACALYGVNYYRSLGNLGDLSIIEGRPMSLNARRLTELTIVPSVFNKPEFRPSYLEVNAPLLETVDIHNTSLMGGQLDLSGCPRLQSVNATGCPRITEVKIPETNRLTTVNLGVGITTLAIANVPRLSVLTFENNQYSQITSLSIDCPSWGQQRSQELVQAILSIANVNTLRLTGIEWYDINVNIVDAMANAINNIVTGFIRISDPSATVNGMTFAHKIKFLKKWGNIDDPNNSIHLEYTYNDLTGLTLDGRVYVLLDGKFVSENDQYTYDYYPANEYQNTIQSLSWALDGGSSQYGSIDPTTGVLTINREACQSAPDGTYITVVCTALCYNGQNTFTVDGTFNVYVYNRTPKLGDLVYADGSACDVRYIDKTVVGVCCYINPNPKDSTKPERICVSLKMVAVDQKWGCYNYVIGSDTTPYGEAIYDLPYLPNVQSDGTQYHGYTTGTMRGGDNVDSEGFNIMTDATRASYNNNITGNWGFIDVTQAFVDRLGNVDAIADPKRQRRYLPDGVTVGSRVPRSMINTLQIIRHRDIILENIPISESQTGLPRPESRDANGIGISQYVDQSTFVEAVSETNDLTSLIGQVVALKGATYDTVYYPAASYCYAYEPVVQEGEVLADCFKRHRWMLPSCGFLARLWWYNYQGTNVELETAIFAKARAAGVYTMWTTSDGKGMFSSTESSTSTPANTAFHIEYRTNPDGNITNSNKSDKANAYAIATF